MSAPIPSTASATIAEREQAHTSGAYAKRSLVWVRGQGCTVYDEAGRAYLDLTSGQGVALLGHAHPDVAQAVARQAQTLITCAEAFYNDQRAALYERLSALLPPEFGGGRFFLCNSGAEAQEGALKVARLLTGRANIVAAKRGFHGRTLGALGLTWNKDYREPFMGWTPPVRHISYNDLASAEAAIDETVCAVVVEPVQGEGGVYPANPEWLVGLRRLCDERGALLVMDEIQSGLGRCGRWFAYQMADIVPDIITLGKGIAGGLPMGAVIWRAALGTIPAGTHGSTFGGNPLSCAAACAALDALRAADLPAHSARLGAWLLEALRTLKLPTVREVRGLGLIVGLELRDRVTPVLQALQERGVLALPAGKTVLRLLPPLIIQQSELERAVDAIREVLHAVCQ
ncbi:MAG: aspartate aminotransferase family protein [Anaerolineae bacterium]|nr:aspartate aminotransferase family protein [Anaerolineae bacterium]MDW8172738.1 aspartate aminotransferase family protein [Anaerolineae bacterium]